MNNKKITVVADFETYEEQEEIDLKKKTIDSYVYGAGYSIIEWGKITEDKVKTFYGLRFEAIAKFFDSLVLDIKEFNVREVELYFHNSSYDAGYIGDYILSITPDWKPDFIYTEGKRELIIASFKYKGIKFIIRCSYIWSRLSLASYPVKDGKGNVIEKLDFDDHGKFNIRETYVGWVYQTPNKTLKKFEKEKEDAYLRRDVFKLHYIVLDIRNQKEVFWSNVQKGEDSLIDYVKFTNCITIPSISKRSVEIFINEYLDESAVSKLQKSFFRPIIADDFRVKLDRCLKGGLTTNNIYLSKNLVGIIDTELDIDKEIPKDYIKVGQYYISPKINIFSYDFNSMYPFIMTGRIPKGVPRPWTGKVNKGEEVYFYFTTTKIRAKKEYQQIRTIILGGTTNELLNDFQEREKYANNQSVLIRKDNLFFVLSMYDIWVDDIQLTKENVWEVINEIYVWETSNQLAEFMEETYRKRIEYKEKRDAQPKGSYNYILYDTLQNVNKLIMNACFGKLCQKTIENCYKWDETKKSITLQEEQDIDNYSTVGGNFVTMEGRTLILKAIKEVIDAGEEFLYADTDSITLRAHNKRWKEFVNIDNFNYETKNNKGKLGVLKFEGEYNIFVTCPKKKRYVKYNYFLDNWEHWKKGNSIANIEKVFNFAYGGFNKKALYDLIISYIPTEPTEKTGFLLPLLILFRPDINVLFKGFHKQKIVDSRGFNHIRIINGDKESNGNLKRIDYIVKNNKLLKV